MAFKKQLVTSCKQAIWGEILGGNAPNYADVSKPAVAGAYSSAPMPLFPMNDNLSTGDNCLRGIWFWAAHCSKTLLPHLSGGALTLTFFVVKGHFMRISSADRKK